MNNLLVVVMVLGVSFMSAQAMAQAGATQRGATNDDGSFIGRRFATIDEDLTIAPRYSEVNFAVFRRVSGPASFVESIRKEISIWSGTLPDLSGSWLGIFCYVRNPLRYGFAPENSYPHQIGFCSGDWNLSVDGIKLNSLQDMNIILRFSPGRTLTLFVKRSDILYTFDLALSGKLPWE